MNLLDILIFMLYTMVSYFSWPFSSQILYLIKNEEEKKVYSLCETSLPKASETGPYIVDVINLVP